MCLCVFTSYYPTSTLAAAGSILHRKLSVTALSGRNVDAAAETFQPLKGKFKGQRDPVGGPAEGNVSGVCSSQQPPPNDAIQHNDVVGVVILDLRCFFSYFFLMRIFTCYWGGNHTLPPIKYPVNSPFHFTTPRFKTSSDTLKHTHQSPYLITRHSSETNVYCRAFRPQAFFFFLSSYISRMSALLLR